jgi:hypothetical protein
MYGTEEDYMQATDTEENNWWLTTPTTNCVKLCRNAPAMT